MADVTDQYGVRWSVYRKWYSVDVDDIGSDFFDTIIFIFTLPFLLAWPIWFILKWLGVPWKIVIEQNGRKVGHERVWGWRRSGRRIDEIARSVSRGGGGGPGGFVF